MQLNILRSLHNPARFITLKLLDKTLPDRYLKSPKGNQIKGVILKYHDQVNSPPFILSGKLVDNTVRP
jgi:hypothetical protein